MRVRGNTDFLQNQLLNAVAPKSATSPSSPVEGQYYYDTGKGMIYVYAGSTWIPCGLASHFHLISDITGLQNALDNKTPYGHTHYLSDILDWEGELALANHTHPISDITGLQSALDAKASYYHGHSISDVSGLQSALDGKAAYSHAHVIGDVSGLQSAIDAKTDKGHGHVISDITALQSTLDGKAAASHSHAISDVTNLQTSLDSKVNRAGASMSGALVAYFHGTATNWEIVNVAYGTSVTPPSNPCEGCVYIQYS